MALEVISKKYFNISYDSKERFVSYWHQIHELIKLKSTSYLEIGIGNSLVADYLKQRNFNVTTMDVNHFLNPDLVGSITNTPFNSNSFEVVACFELLEHLPYKQFIPLLKETHRISKKFTILSLPDANRVISLYIHLPRVGELKRLIKIPRLHPPIHQFKGRHFWEIGKAEFPLKRVISDIKRAGFSIADTYRIFENPYHRFFILKK